MKISSIIVVIIISVSLQNSLTYSQYNDQIFDPGLEFQNEISTNLDLSAWELYVLTDLTFKLTSMECPNIDTVALSSLKEYLIDSYKQVSTSIAQHEDFIRVYSSLVKCTDVLVESKGELDEEINKVSTDKRKELGRKMEEHQSGEADWTVNTPVLSTTPGTPIWTIGIEESTIKSRWSSLYKWLVGVLGFTSGGANPESKKTLDSWKLADQKRKQNILYKSAQQNFANFFHGTSKIIRRVCPSHYRPHQWFMRKALLDMTIWATVDQHDAITASNRYFKANNLLESVEKCFKGL